MRIESSGVIRFVTMVKNDTIEVRVRFPLDRFAQTMSLVPLGDDLYRINNSGLLSDLSYFDIIEASRESDDTLVFQRVVEKSKWRQFEYVLSERLVDPKNGLDVIINKIMKLGGNWENFFGGVVMIYLPPGVDYDPSADIQKLADKFK